MYLVWCTNTHHDVTNLVNCGMVKNTKTWIYWERNIVFLRNRKILNLCRRWHILRSYRFVVEVTFKSSIFSLWPYKLKVCCMFLISQIPLQFYLANLLTLSVSLGALQMFPFIFKNSSLPWIIAIFLNTVLEISTFSSLLLPVTWE